MAFQGPTVAHEVASTSFRFPETKSVHLKFSPLSVNSQDAISISLWDSKTNADAYNTNTYPEVLRTFAKMIDGTPKVQTFEAVTSTLHTLVAA
jgi:hypothetical protein